MGEGNQIWRRKTRGRERKSGREGEAEREREKAGEEGSDRGRGDGVVAAGGREVGPTNRSPEAQLKREERGETVRSEPVQTEIQEKKI